MSYEKGGVADKLETKEDKFIIAIEETVVENFEIIAELAEKALEIAKEQYKNGCIVLDSGEVQFRQMAIMEPDGEAMEWCEF